jgi:uncharacterized protein with von Willebrand factor type A (vWA) domain
MAEAQGSDPDLTECTVVAIDCSFSTALRGVFDSIKAAALTVDSLAQEAVAHRRMRFLKFAAYAEQLDREQLPTLNWNESVLGTNHHHAYLLSKELLDVSPAALRRVIMLTDGEPTAHLQEGRSLFALPPSPITIRETLAAARSCVESGIVATVVMVNHRPAGPLPTGAARLGHQGVTDPTTLAMLETWGRHLDEVVGVRVVHATPDAAADVVRAIYADHTPLPSNASK